ncbi:MAG: putative dehydrogenase [Verrucomicrobiales bacterium]|jgi:predicted dehydrogenase
MSNLNFALLGAGWFGREAHLRNLVNFDGVNVVSASSRSESSLTAAKEIVGEQLRTFTDWHEALAIDEVDAVVIALTNDLHHEAAIAAFEAGKHVMLEKPMGMTIRECDEILAASAAAGKTLQIGHEMRFQRLYQKMKAMIDRGDVGDLHLMWCREFRGPMRVGWRSSEALTGGTLLEKNCHHFDLFNWILGRPVKVAAHGGRNVHLDREVLDNAQVIVEHEGGRRATLELCLFAPFGGECEIGVAGSGGRIDTENQALRLVHQRFDIPERTEMAVGDFAEDANFVDSSGRVDRGIRPELEHFIECVREGKTPMNDGESAKLSVAVCLAAQESIRRGETVLIDEFLKA